MIQVVIELTEEMRRTLLQGGERKSSRFANLISDYGQDEHNLLIGEHYYENYEESFSAFHVRGYHGFVSNRL